VLTPEVIDRYRRLDGASVSNAIETFGLRLRNEGFADASLRCLVPDQAPAIGYAVTARIRCSAPPPVGLSYHDRTDWWHYIVSTPAPRIVVVQDEDEHPGLGAFVGDVHTAILQALGCVGYATNGTVRDVAAVRALEPEHDAHERALACAVLSEDRVHLARMEVEIDAAQHEHLAERFLDRSDGEHRSRLLHHTVTPRATS